MSEVGQLRTPATHPCHVRSWVISRRNQHDNGRRQKPFHRHLKKFQILAGRKPLGPLCPSRGNGTFFRGAGSAAHTREGSISSPRRATAGVQVSIDLGLGPLLGLNAVSTIGGQGAPWRGPRRPGRRSGTGALHLRASWAPGEQDMHEASGARVVACLPAVRTGRG